MADPVVHITNGVPDSGTGNITTLGAVVTALGTVNPPSTAPTALAPSMIVSVSPNGINSNGQATKANSAPVVIASDQFGAGEYETVAASQTAQVLGTTGAVGDFINGILVIPATTSPGVVTLLDGATSIPVFVGGASSLVTLQPFFIQLGIISVSGGWKITTGANLSCIGIGSFT